MLWVVSDKKPKRPALLVGDDFGDDDEATAVDFSIGDEVREALKRSAPEIDDEDSHTEILRPLPARADLPPEAQKARGVVALDDGGERLMGQSGKHAASKRRPGAETTVEPHDVDEDAETLQLTRPPSEADTERPATDGGDGPEVRALDDLAPPIGSWDESDDKTLSRPRVVRMTFSPDKHPPPGVDERLPNTSTKKRAGGIRKPATGEEAEELPPGKLVVSAPENATVFVDGVERGRGSVTLEDVDRHARLSVRVHQPGCRPWTRAVTLGGTPELRVTASPEPR